MNICVFCSAYNLDSKYTRPAETLAKLIATRGHHLIWGGSDRGIMQVMARGVQKGGGKIHGISVAHLKDHAHKNADEMIIAKDLGERKAMMLKRSDAVIVMVGGLGTLDEITDILELKKHGIHNKPVVVLNTKGFYDPLQAQLRLIEREGFLPRPLDELVVFVKDPEEAIKLAEQESS